MLWCIYFASILMDWSFSKYCKVWIAMRHYLELTQSVLAFDNGFLGNFDPKMLHVADQLNSRNISKILFCLLYDWKQDIHIGKGPLAHNTFLKNLGWLSKFNSVVFIYIFKWAQDDTNTDPQDSY